MGFGPLLLGGAGTGFKLGPVPNVFTTAGDKTAAEALRDAQAAADPAWLAAYEADPTLSIALEFTEAGNEVAEMQLRDEVAAGGGVYTWYDSATFKGLRGVKGDSAYQTWLDAGNTGTEADFLASLNGEDGLSIYPVFQNAASEPATPVGTAIPPTGWSLDATNPPLGEFTWMSYTYVEDITVHTGNGFWADSIRMTGRDGTSGGAYRIVTTITDRDAIPTGERELGLHVFVTFEDKEYYLAGGITNADWVEVTFGGGTGGGAFTVVDAEADRLAIPAVERFDGLHVFQKDNNTTWYLNGGISNADWEQELIPMYRVVQNGTERDAIPAAERQEGMSVYLKSNDKTFILGAGLTNSDWMNIMSIDRTWTGNNRFTQDVRTDSKFVGIGAIDSVDQSAGRVLTANSNTEGDYTWVDLPAGTTDTGFHVVATQADMLALPTTEIVDGTHVYVTADQRLYRNLFGINVSIADWKNVLSYSTTFTGQVRVENHQIQLGFDAGDVTQGTNSVAVGAFAGTTNQGDTAVAVGESAGNDNQSDFAVAVGNEAGETRQGEASVAIGNKAAELNQSEDAVAIGNQAGYQGQGFDSIAIGHEAGKTHQANRGIILNASGSEKNHTTDGHLGIYTGGAQPLNIYYTGSAGSKVTFDQSIEVTGTARFEGDGAVPPAVADNQVLTSHADGSVSWQIGGGGAGFDTAADYTVTGDWQFQGDVRSSSNEVHLGNSAGLTGQGANAIAIGTNAGNNTQGTNSVSVGNRAGRVNQGVNAVALGLDAGNSNQSDKAVAIGVNAGETDQGESSVAIGVSAGKTSQGDNSIIISSKGTTVDNTNDGSLQIETDDISIRFDGGTGPLSIDKIVSASGFIGAGTVGSTGQAPDRVLTANSATPGDYTWKAPAAGNQNYRIAADIAGRDAIPAVDRQEGMAVFVQADKDIYTLMGGIADANWVRTNQYFDTLVTTTTFTATIAHVVNGVGRLHVFPTPGFDVTITVDGTGFTNGDTLEIYNHMNTDNVLSIVPAGGFKIDDDPARVLMLRGNQSATLISDAASSNFGSVVHVEEAPYDGSSYVRQDGKWEAVAGVGFDPTANYAVSGDWQFEADVRYKGNEIHLGEHSGEVNQGNFGIAVGREAGQNNQGLGGIAFGNLAGQNSQGQHSLAAGNQAGQVAQGEYALAVGDNAASTRQGSHALAVGKNAGQTDQGQDASAVGENAGQTSQGQGAIAYGKNSGQTRQGLHSIALGTLSGNSDLGDNAIAIGNQSGTINQGANSIVINSSGASVSNTHDSSLTVHTGELSIDFNGAADDHLTINKEIDVADITITASRLITGVPI